MHQPGQLETTKPKGRSRVTNARLRGRITAKSLFCGEIDGRSIWARRYRDLVCSYVDDAGGIGAISELRHSLIRRIAALTVEAERLEVDLASGREVDVDLLARLSSHIRRIAETIGLDRVVKDITPDLADIIAQHHREESAVPRKPASAPRTIGGATIPSQHVEPLSASPGPSAEAAE
jgi:hypothetical protein